MRSICEIVKSSAKRGRLSMKTVRLFLNITLVLCVVSFLGCDSEDEEGTGCYTPCKDGVQVDGRYIHCSDEGLIEGCYGNTKCVDKWCVLDSSKKAKANGIIRQGLISGNGNGPDSGLAPDTDSLGPGGNTDGTCVDDCDCGCLLCRCHYAPPLTVMTSGDPTMTGWSRFRPIDRLPA